MGTAEEIYKNINSEKDIDDLISNQEAETLHLDFKAKKDPSTHIIDNDFRSLLSKAISGFANSAGGVLVIGIKAPNEGPYEKVPIENVSSFEQEVNKMLSRVTDRPVLGVVTKKILSSNACGFLLILIPASDFAPHRTVTKDKQYYLRVGDSFVPMEHYQIEDTFGRRHHPKLTVFAKLKYTKQQKYHEIWITIFIRNNGRALAKFPMLKLNDITQELVADNYGINGNGKWFIKPVDGRFDEFRGGIDDVIHPGTEIPILKYRLDITHNAVPKPTYLIKGILAAESFLNQTFEIVIDDSKILNLINGQLSESNSIVEGSLEHFST